MRFARTLAAIALVLLAGGCATAPRPEPAEATPASVPRAAWRTMVIDPQIEERILALDPERVSDGDVRTVLAAGPTPRIIGLHGGIYPVHLLMDSFGRFLVGMGYPDSRIRHPGDGQRSVSPYENSEQIAGVIAWHYENEGIAGHYVETNPTGRFLFVENDDRPGMVGTVGMSLGSASVNIANMALSRTNDRSRAVTVIEVDTEPPVTLLENLRQTPGILRVLSFEL